MTCDIQEVLRIVHDWTCRFLQTNLPTIGGDDWWNKCVRWKLSVSQEKMLDERNITNLQNLDLAALLRVMDKNWRELSIHLHLPRDGRTVVNEVRNIRNRLAHESLSGIPLEDQQRNADTLMRYLQLIGADEEAVQLARNLKRELMHRIMAEDLSAEEVELQNGPEDESTSELPEEAIETPGVPKKYLGPRVAVTQEIHNAMNRATYVGIDFGTSTTVVSVVIADDQTGRLQVEPISIRQIDDMGREINHHLLPSCIAWSRNRLLVGHGAAELRPKLREGQNVWSSFKMRLGINLGPQYPNTLLSREQGHDVVIECPQDAARVFFEYIREAVEDYVQSRGLPPRIYYAVSVPAAFEANQRQDLMNALADAGIPVEESSFIDEPNAAFLSYLIDMEQNAGSRFMDSLAQKERRVLVFDFGAGTCDISILEIKIENNRLSSRNLAISKFMALGGDDIDRAIARDVLLPQLCGGKSPSEIFSTREIEALMVPRLKPEAERLKIQCSKMAEDAGLCTLEDLRRQTEVVEGESIPPISLRGQKWELKDPKISLAQFAEVMEPFLADPPLGDSETREGVVSVLEPVSSALGKAGLSPDDLDMALFIGGSSENPLVRERIKDYMGRFVDCVTPRDLRAHVSQGAAIHALFVHGFGWELIRPITSEPIYVITRGGNLEQVLPAGTPVPSPDIFVTELRIDRDCQEWVELPFCVSGRDKILAVVSVRPPNPPGCFKKGETVRLSCTITREKLLKVRVRVGDTALTARILNPLANAELTPQDRRLLEARQALNESILAGQGRPSVTAILNYAWAAVNAKRWREAAEMFEAAERLDSERDLATNISYCYAMADDHERMNKWSEIAYERSPNSITAYNLALTMKDKGDRAGYERLMEESLRFDPENTAALDAYGHYLIDKGDSRGVEFVERACDLLSAKLEAGVLCESDFWRLRRAAGTLGRSKVLNDLQEYQKITETDDALVREKYLAAGSYRVDLKYER